MKNSEKSITERVATLPEINTPFVSQIRRMEDGINELVEEIERRRKYMASVIKDAGWSDEELKAAGLGEL